MKMRSMAENHSKLEMSQSPQPYYPSFTVDAAQLPEAKKWKVGKTYQVMVEVKMSGSHLKDNGRRECYDFKMMKLGVHDKV